jgi:transposase
MGTVAANVEAATSKSRRKRQVRSTQERRQIVEETLKPGASVSLVARAYDVNANQLFKWRKLYREGRLDVTPNSNTATTLVPVKISESLPVSGPTVTGRRVRTRRPGTIDIDLGHARVRIEGAADPECVRAALERLSR